MSTWEARRLLSPSPTFLPATAAKAGPSQLRPPLRPPGFQALGVSAHGPSLPKPPLLSPGSPPCLQALVFEAMVRGQAGNSELLQAAGCPGCPDLTVSPNSVWQPQAGGCFS